MPSELRLAQHGATITGLKERRGRRATSQKTSVGGRTKLCLWVAPPATEQWGSGRVVRVHHSVLFSAFDAGSPELNSLPSASTALGEAEPTTRLRWLNTEATCRYSPFCLDFGPYHMGSTAKFCLSLVQAQRMGQPLEAPNRSVVVFCERTPKNLSNAAFVIGAHLIINMGLSAEEAWAAFDQHVPPEDFAHFHDATWEDECFPLTVLDALRGVQRAVGAGYVREFFRGFDEAAYNHYDHPLNGDMHEVVPGKFIAFAGPTKEVEGSGGVYRTLTPAAYEEAFQRFGVTAVVRLNERRENDYDREDFTKLGFDHHDLIFNDCTNPSEAIVARFLDICEQSKGGVIAVHCKAGLGRTGTLIALWMMKHHKFTAREAIGWLRVMRPGSVIYDQQHFLCEMEGAMHRAGKAARGELERGGEGGVDHVGKLLPLPARRKGSMVDPGGKGGGAMVDAAEIKSFFSAPSTALSNTAPPSLGAPRIALDNTVSMQRRSALRSSVPPPPRPPRRHVGGQLCVQLRQ